MRYKPKNIKNSKKNRQKSTNLDLTAQLKKNHQGSKGRFLAWLKNVALGICVAFLGLALVEGALRLVWSPPVSTEDPFVGFSAIHPLFTVKDGVATTSDIRQRYFNKESFPVEKGKNTFRIFSFGESTTYGHPFDGRTAYSRWLQDLLKAACPEKNVEVINAGGISYASYRIVHLVEESLKYSPDLAIIYVGHNEFLERRSYSGLFKQGQTLISLRSYLENLRIYKALDRVISPIIGEAKSAKTKSGKAINPNSKNSGKTLLNDETTAILDKSAGLDLYYRDENFEKGVVKHFEYNLNKMIALCKASGVPVILVETPCNLKDFSPFKSEHNSKLSKSKQNHIDNELKQAKSLIDSGDYKKAIEETNKMDGEDPLYALTYFLKGKALEKERLYDQARANFVKARDLDVCPLRATTPIIETIRRIAEHQKVGLIKFSSFVDSYAKEHGNASGISGKESFLDHVHPTIELHQALAELLFNKIEKMGLTENCKSLDQEEMQSVMDQGLKSLDPSIYTLRDLNLAKTLRWAGKKEEARQDLLRITKRETDNAEVHKMLGSYALEDQQFDEAIEQYKEAVRLSGGDPQLKLSLAIAQYNAGNKKEAEATYEDILHGGQDLPEVYANLSMLWLTNGHLDEATNLLKEGIAKYPDSTALFSPYALALAMSGNFGDAIRWMRKAVDAEPGDPAHYYNLAGMYALNHQDTLAFQTLNTAIDRGYRNLNKILEDPVFERLRNQPEFEKIKSRLE
ncbi:MAG: tetratricopeptide repeat protein [Desulfomonilaceae bacterium]